MAEFETRLTALAHGGGCGCKLSPAMLHELLSGVPMMQHFPDLLVGIETGDDAAVYRLNDTQAVVATTDFFMPIVDDAHDFGRIAATNALSDIYAMGGTPIMALAILGMPLGKVAPATVSRILAGGASVCADAGIPIAGGHSIDSPEPIYGLVAIGIVHPDRILRNSGAQAGDAIILTKGLGVGIISAALKSGTLSDADSSSAYAAMLAATTQLNRIGADLAARADVHAMTDVTGFGLLGHALEMSRGSSLTGEIDWHAVPLLEGIPALAQVPYRTGAAVRNWASYGDAITLPAQMPEWQRDIMCDPQTSGGLLVSVAAHAADGILESLRRAGCAQAAVIGHWRDGPPGLVIRQGA